MKPIITRRLVYTCSIVLLATFLAACGSNPTISTTATVPSSASTPTQAAAPTSAPTPTPASNTGATFKQLKGANFTISYPVGWQTSHKSLPRGQSGDVKNPTMEDIYGFVAPDNITGLHIVRNGDEQAPGGMINQLLDGQFSCSPGDKSVPSQVTVGGVSWSQVDFVCMIAGYNYEVRELVTASTKYGQTVILYGAFQQVNNGAMAPDFAHASNMYFKPMLASFTFN